MLHENSATLIDETYRKWMKEERGLPEVKRAQLCLIYRNKQDDGFEFNTYRTGAALVHEFDTNAFDKNGTYLIIDRDKEHYRVEAY